MGRGSRREQGGTRDSDDERSYRQTREEYQSSTVVLAPARKSEADDRGGNGRDGHRGEVRKHSSHGEERWDDRHRDSYDEKDWERCRRTRWYVGKPEERATRYESRASHSTRADSKRRGSQRQCNERLISQSPSVSAVRSRSPNSTSPIGRRSPDDSRERSRRVCERSRSRRVCDRSRSRRREQPPPDRPPILRRRKNDAAEHYEAKRVDSYNISTDDETGFQGGRSCSSQSPNRANTRSIASDIADTTRRSPSKRKNSSKIREDDHYESKKVEQEVESWFEQISPPRSKKQSKTSIEDWFAGIEAQPQRPRHDVLSVDDVTKEVAVDREVQPLEVPTKARLKKNKSKKNPVDSRVGMEDSVALGSLAGALSQVKEKIKKDAAETKCEQAQVGVKSGNVAPVAPGPNLDSVPVPVSIPGPTSSALRSEATAAAESSAAVERDSDGKRCSASCSRSSSSRSSRSSSRSESSTDSDGSSDESCDRNTWQSPPSVATVQAATVQAAPSSHPQAPTVWPAPQHSFAQPAWPSNQQDSSPRSENHGVRCELPPGNFQQEQVSPTQPQYPRVAGQPPGQPIAHLHYPPHLHIQPQPNTAALSTTQPHQQIQPQQLPQPRALHPFPHPLPFGAAQPPQVMHHAYGLPAPFLPGLPPPSVLPYGVRPPPMYPPHGGFWPAPRFGVAGSYGPPPRWQRSRSRNRSPSQNLSRSPSRRPLTKRTRVRTNKKRKNRTDKGPTCTRDPPSKMGGDAWERNREEVGLQLIGDKAPPGTNWHYLLKDESRRCYVGYLQCPIPVELNNMFFTKVLEGTVWAKPLNSIGVEIPRKTAWMVKDGCRCGYRYGGLEVSPTTFPNWMREVMATYMPFYGLNSVDEWPDCCNVNLYDDDNASVGWHSDDEALFQGLHVDIRILSLSLGCARKFQIKANWLEAGEADAPGKVLLSDGDLCTMEGMFQKHYMHRVPRGGTPSGPRINLTWRWIVRHEKVCPCRVKNW